MEVSTEDAICDTLASSIEAVTGVSCWDVIIRWRVVTPVCADILGCHDGAW